jgi:acyl-CoA synthetase (AMP-forming)/AMP-acid ligase II/acyl carrier protein
MSLDYSIMQGDKKNIFDYVAAQALAFSKKDAFILLDNQENVHRRISYTKLEAEVKELAWHLRTKNFYGQRIMLFYQDPIQFIIAFLACQYEGAIPVPVAYAKSDSHFLKLKGIFEDAQVKSILCSSVSVQALQRSLRTYLPGNDIAIIDTDQVRIGDSSLVDFRPQYHNISFLQYTSGSTSQPKGVMVSNQNLLSNQKMIAGVFGCTQDSVILSWLPFYHDMGLIGNILHAIYTGCSCILMSPMRFIQKPQCWLEAISKYKVTHSGGPNFSYDRCIDRVSIDNVYDLDLSAWKVAFNGSEPVRWKTIQDFAKLFNVIGFNENAFYPCYGLAEGTLLVAGEKNEGPPVIKMFDPDAQSIEAWNNSPQNSGFPLVSCGGIASGVEVKIISISEGIECEEGKMGEIHIAGPNVTEGYWNKNRNLSFTVVDSKPFFKTGDLGCFYAGELFVAGRQKEMLIIHGQNYFPYDVELIASDSHPAIESNGVAVFNHNDSVEIIVVAEIKRICLKRLQPAEIINCIDQAIIAHFGLIAFDILLITSSGLPRTTSGKIQRLKCQQVYRTRSFEVIESKQNITKAKLGAEKETQLLQKVLQEPIAQNIKLYVISRIESRVGFSGILAIDEETKLTDLGLDSLRGIELINELNSDFDINLDAPRVLGSNSFSSLVEWIENILWLKNEPVSEERIII